MAAAFRSLLAHFFPRQEYRALILGLDGRGAEAHAARGSSARSAWRHLPHTLTVAALRTAAGKTSILYRLKLNELVTTIPTMCVAWRGRRGVCL
jgi:hypothetical protein